MSKRDAVDYYDDNCPICIQLIQQNKFKTACGHVFHKVCLTQWKERSLSCPICRDSLTRDNSVIHRWKERYVYVKIGQNGVCYGVTHDFHVDILDLVTNEVTPLI